MTRVQKGTIAPEAVAEHPLRLGVIYNTHSGRHRRRWGTPRLGADIPAFEANNPDEIGPALTRLAEQGVELLAVAGGDGTVQSVLTHVMLREAFPQMPLLALVPTGSTNMTGGDVGTVNIHRHGWQRLVDWAARPQAPERHLVRRPVLRIQPGDGRPFCGMFFGAGAIHHAVQHTQSQLHSKGLRGEVGPGLAFMRFVKAVATRDRRLFAPVSVRLRDAEGHSLDTDSLLLLVSTLNRLLLRFRPFWNTEETGPVHWSVVEDGAQSFLRRLPAVCRGRGAVLAPECGYHSHNTERLELLFNDGYIVDGEFFQTRAADGPVVLSSAGEATFVRL